MNYEIGTIMFIASLVAIVVISWSPVKTWIKDRTGDA